MANTIKIKRGKSNNLSVSNLQDGELALTLDTNKLYTNKGQISPDNVYVGDTEPTDSNVKCWISPSGKIDLSSLWDQIYPVGSIYITVNATSPAVLFGGEWEQIKDTFLLACGSTYSNGSTGGSATHIHSTGDHTLTVDEMPSHTHTEKLPESFRISANAGSGGYVSDATNPSTPYAGGTYSSSVTTGSTGKSKPHNHGNTGSTNHMPPYLAVYVWKRIS